MKHDEELGELKVFLVHKVIEVFFLRSQQAKVVNEVAEIFPLKGKSNILPTESKFRLFSKEEDERYHTQMNCH